MRTGFKAQEADSLWKNYLPELVPFETSLARITRYISKVSQCSPLALTLIASSTERTSKEKSLLQKFVQAFLVLKRDCALAFCLTNSQYTSVIEVNACPLPLYNVTRSAWLDISVHKSVRGRIDKKMSENVNHEEIQLLGVGGWLICH